jgi:hypothetical protein
MDSIWATSRQMKIPMAYMVATAVMGNMADMGEMDWMEP